MYVHGRRQSDNDRKKKKQKKKKKKKKRKIEMKLSDLCDEQRVKCELSRLPREITINHLPLLYTAAMVVTAPVCYTHEPTSQTPFETCTIYTPGHTPCIECHCVCYVDLSPMAKKAE